MKTSPLAIAGLALCAAILAGGCAAPTIQVSTPTRDGKVVSEAPLLFHVIDGEADFQALVGPLEPGHQDLQVTIDPASPDIVLGMGWSYMFGRYPRAQGRLVHASATGTTAILAVYPGFDRVVFLCSDAREGVEVKSLHPVASGSTLRTLGDRWFYVDASDQTGGAVTFSAIRSVPKPGDPDPDGARALVEKVRAVVQQLGLPGWCPQP